MPLSYRASVMAQKGGAALATGVLYMAGQNASGQMGDGTVVDKSTLTVIGSGFTNVFASDSMTLALKNGQLWGWGLNVSGGLGLGDTASRSSPVQVGAASDWVYIHASRTDPTAHSAGLRSASPLANLYVWGNNQSGQLGLGDTVDRSSPVQLGTNSDWWMISMGYGNTFGIRSTVNDAGTLWAWGYNFEGQLGINNTNPFYSSPVQVGTRSDWQIISAGDTFSLALTYDYNTGARELWSWGTNAGGQLGLGDTTDRSSPVQIGTDTDWLNISAGGLHSLAIKTDGTLWSWGFNYTGQLGLNDLVDRSSPVQVGADTDWVWINSGIEQSMAIKNNGTIWVWGANSYGAFANGAQDVQSSPIQVGSFTNYAIPQENFLLSIHSLGQTLGVIRDET